MSAFTQAVEDGLVLTKRNVLKNLRNPDIVVFTSAAPIAFALLFGFVFGSAIDVHGSNYREFMIIGILTQTMLLTASNTGVGIAHDMKLGLVDRFRSLPISQSAVLVGRTSGDAVNNVLVIILMSLTGLLMGWRIRSNFLDAALAFLLLFLFAYAASWITAAIGLTAKSPEVLGNVMLMVLLPLTFISNSFVPSEGLPKVLQVVADWNPVSAVVEACRQLFGNIPAGRPEPEVWPLQHPVLSAFLWVALILVIFVPLSIRRYAKAVGR
ncbi:ABC transporter permease [Streptomyces sp. NPDC048430]|uniref:Transport permease protein n=2 Tax=Streptomyces rubiginosohelvolus TaxID=67362 RepID=A0ABW6FBL3_9ACTN|nr:MULTISPECIES: ABC transporter permease [Streptomyces]WAS29247.1 ABC-transporter [Streptomyces sp.]KFK86040.1 ABC transporter [Streptomyces sp. JS01]MBK3528122.1 ABC transporter permease [Streptomyces sp. MBT72]MBK3535357.1 ABC transporter permease [Streptomyces sp. MBT67]MBK3542086.1 ABC transporter permease [Streptomyces sp. MBT60]